MKAHANPYKRRKKRTSRVASPTLEDVYYEALRTRDQRFDGKFFVGVKTTGIYCRPICPAKPRRENVEFFSNHLEAERRGYRPCLRCRPESAPKSSAWIGTTAIVQRAVKALGSQEALAQGEDHFADRFGVTARHLRRLFVDQIGKTPRQIAQENRLNLARKLITETRLAMSEVAFAAGFSSIRRFNDTFKDRFKRSPSEIRRSPIAKESGLVISLSYRPPYNFGALFESYRAHQIGDLESFEGNVYRRVVAFDHQVGTISVSNDPAGSRLMVRVDVPDMTKIPEILARVRSMFDLDSDPLIIANALESEPAMKKLLKKHRGIRMATGWDAFEMAITTILGQLVSVARGRQLVADLIERLGEDSGLEVLGPNGERKAIKLFPSPQKIATADLTSLKTTAVRKKTLKLFTAAIEAQKISLEPTQDVGAFIENVRAIPGIGPWTASYMALKCLRHTDAFPETDLLLARALEHHSKAALEKMSPWRGYVAMLLWREYAMTPKKVKA